MEKVYLCPQAIKLLQHLKSNKNITQRSALIDLGIMSLGKRISDLRQAGYKITTDMLKNKFTGQRFGRYTFHA